MHCCMKVITLWHCVGVMEAQVALTAAFRSSALSCLVSLSTTAHRFTIKFKSKEFSAQSRSVFAKVTESAFGSFGRVGGAGK